MQVISESHLDWAALQEAGYKETDAVVFGPDPTLSDAVYDAQLVADIMVLQVCAAFVCITRAVGIVRFQDRKSVV